METSAKKFIEVMKEIQINLLEYLECEDYIDEKYKKLKKLFDANKIYDNQFKIKPLFYLILKISNNMYRESDFFNKIFSVLELFKDDISKYFTNNELFHIFKSNKRLLLFLIEEKIMTIDESIAKKIIKNIKYKNAKYPQYFQPELQQFIYKKWFLKDGHELFGIFSHTQKLSNDFYEKRKIGQNDNEICKIIRNDSIEDFIIYINENCIPVNSIIKQSIFETNNFLLKKDNKNVSLIEYAVFCGSIRIYNYLKRNNANLKSLFIYAIHSKNAEIINDLEENKILPSKKDLIFKESIKCHHNDIANYIQCKYFNNATERTDSTLINCLKYYNFMMIKSNIEITNLFYYLSKYDYYLLVSILFHKIKNEKSIYIEIFMA